MEFHDSYESPTVSTTNGETTKVLIFAFVSSMKTHQPVFTCSKSIMETPEQCDKYVQI